MPSTESAPAQRTPAWKRLGLKLKQPAGAALPASEPPNSSSAVGQPSGSGGSTGHKRKGEAPPSTDGSPVKRTRREEQPVTQTPSSSSKPKKSVKFGDTPSKHDGRSPPPARSKSKPTNEAQKAKKPKGPAKKQTPPSTDIKPALEYLRLWKTSRENWKFNKNHQSALIRHIFEPDSVPASDVDNFYEYIRDLKGFVRTRLRETAMEVQMRDVSDGTAGFPDDTMDLDDKQETYDSILADILRRKRQQNGPKRKFFSEAQYVAESQDGDVIIRRLVKRLRAELVIEELSDSGEETENMTTSTPSRTVTAGDNNTTTTTNGDKQPKVTEGSGKRRRKLRVNMEDSSSSESESENDSDTSSSSSSSSEEDSDSEDGAGDRANDGYDTSSSSSSSSSSGEDSDSDEESDDEE